MPGHDFHAQRVDWGKPLEGSARELMAVEQPDDSSHALDDAEDFLEEALRNGAVPTKELKAAAAAHGHRWRTVERAKERVGVTATKEGFQTSSSIPSPAKRRWRVTLADAEVRVFEAVTFRVEGGALVLVLPAGCAAAFAPGVWRTCEPEPAP